MSSSTAPQTNSTSNHSSSSSSSSGKSLSESLLPLVQEGHTPTSLFTAQVSNWLNLYQSQGLNSYSIEKDSNKATTNHVSKSMTGRKNMNMVQSYAELMASYEYGLHHISTLHDFTQGKDDTPDNFMHGNFPSVVNTPFSKD